MPTSRRRPARTKDDLAPELRFLGALWQLDHALESASRSMKRKFGVTGRERLFVRFVGQRPGITPGELAGLMHLHPSGVTALLKRLERRGVVRRSPAPEDARRVRLLLTPAGERIDALRSGTVEAGVRAALGTLGPNDVEVAAGVLVALAERLAAGASAARRSRRTNGAAQP